MGTGHSFGCPTLHPSHTSITYLGDGTEHPGRILNFCGFPALRAISNSFAARKKPEGFQAVSASLDSWSGHNHTMYVQHT